MHQRIKDEMKEFNLTLSEIEAKIECPKNYLSQFINGTRDLPKKWEKAIDDFFAGIRQHLKKLDPPPLNPDILRPWIVVVEKYCREVAGIDPEKLVEEHRSQIKEIKALKEKAKVSVINLTPEPPKTNYTINTSNPLALSNWAEENRKKKLGLK